MNTFYLKRFRKEADKYYHIRLNEQGKYDVNFHNYKLTKMASNLSRNEAFKELERCKREHILKRIKLEKKSTDKIYDGVAKFILYGCITSYIIFKIVKIFF